MPNHIFNVFIYHIFIKNNEPIRFASEDELQAAIQKAVTYSSWNTQRIFEFNTLEEAQAKANEVKLHNFWLFDEGYTRPGKWYYFEAEVAQIFEERILENGDFDEEPVSESEYYHPDIPLQVIEAPHQTAIIYKSEN